MDHNVFLFKPHVVSSFKRLQTSFRAAQRVFNVHVVFYRTFTYSYKIYRDNILKTSLLLALTPRLFCCNPLIILPVFSPPSSHLLRSLAYAISWAALVLLNTAFVTSELRIPVLDNPSCAVVLSGNGRMSQIIRYTKPLSWRVPRKLTCSP